jgi:hypothetical protein
MASISSITLHIKRSKILASSQAQKYVGPALYLPSQGLEESLLLKRMKWRTNLVGKNFGSRGFTARGSASSARFFPRAPASFRSAPLPHNSPTSPRTSRSPSYRRSACLYPPSSPPYNDPSQASPPTVRAPARPLFSSLLGETDATSSLRMAFEIVA